MGDVLMELKDIGLTYGRGKRSFEALSPMSLQIHEGERVAIVGQSGAGKSRIALIAAQLEQPTCGSLLWKGRDITHARGKELRAMRSHVQLVGQDPMRAFDPRWNMERTIGEALLSFGRCVRSDVSVQVRSLLSRVELPKAYASKLPHELSGGELQRCSIARALAVDPELLILDEATSALDMTVQEKILQLLERVHRDRGCAFLFIHHDIAVAQRMSDRIVVMRGGKVETSFDSRDLMQVDNAYVSALVSSMFEV